MGTLALYIGLILIWGSTLVLCGNVIVLTKGRRAKGVEEVAAA